MSIILQNWNRHLKKILNKTVPVLYFLCQMYRAVCHLELIQTHGQDISRLDLVAHISLYKPHPCITTRAKKINVVNCWLGLYTKQLTFLCVHIYMYMYICVLSKIVIHVLTSIHNHSISVLATMCRGIIKLRILTYYSNTVIDIVSYKISRSSNAYSQSSFMKSEAC